MTFNWFENPDWFRCLKGDTLSVFLHGHFDTVLIFNLKNGCILHDHCQTSSPFLRSFVMINSADMQYFRCWSKFNEWSILVQVTWQLVLRQIMSVCKFWRGAIKVVLKSRQLWIRGYQRIQITVELVFTNENLDAQNSTRRLSTFREGSTPPCRKGEYWALDFSRPPHRKQFIIFTIMAHFVPLPQK